MRSSQCLSYRRRYVGCGNFLQGVGSEAPDCYSRKLYSGDYSQSRKRRQYCELKSIFDGFKKVGEEIPIILPLHPRTRKIIETLDLKTSDAVKIIDPVSYLEIIYLLENCALVMTGSGGLQKEAFFFKKPCITMRDETEWIELVAHGFNYLTGAVAEKMYRAYKNIFGKNCNFNIELYGDGKAGAKIVKILRIE